MPSPSRGRPTHLVGVVTLCLLYFTSGCNSNTLTPSGATSTATDDEFHVVLVGPWAIAPDPDNSNGILAIAPNVINHGPLFVRGNPAFTLLPGEYTLNFANVSTSPQDTSSPLNEKITKQTLQGVQGNTAFKRYALHLPNPNARGEYGGYSSRVDENGKWPVDQTTNEKHYTTEISLKYGVVDLSSVTLSGHTDPLPFGTGPLAFTAAVKMGSPAIIFIGTEPSVDDLDTCSTQSKMAFRELVGLFNLKKTIDYPRYAGSYDPGCQQCDPQGPNSQTTCPSTATLSDLEVVRAAVRRTPPSSEKDRVLGDTKDIEALISGKGRPSGGQKDLMMKLAELQGYLKSVRPQDSALGKLDDIIKPMVSPNRDCKSPLLSLSTQ